MENQNTNTPEKVLTLEEKAIQVSAAWSKIGLVMSQTDMRLQAMVQKSLAKIKIPTQTSEIVEAEKLVVTLRNDYTECQTERKKVTSKLDGAITHLMKSEKLLAEAVPALTTAILNLKKQAEAENQKVKFHDDEIKRNKEIIATHLSNYDASCKSKIINIVDKAFSYALGNGDIKVQEVEAYLKKVMKKFLEAEFTLTVPMWQSKYTTQDENKELWDNAAMEVKEPMFYRDDLNTALQAKFEYYNIAVKNKQASLLNAAAEKAEAEAAIQKAAAEAEAGNKLAALATDHSAVPVQTHKDIKRVYEIDKVENDWLTAQIVVSAFIVNLDKVKDLIRVKSIWNLSIEQMAEALCKLKTKDPAFEFGTLKFKLVEKL